MPETQTPETPDTIPSTPLIPATRPEVLPSVPVINNNPPVKINTPIIQVVGGQRYQLQPETSAEQVLMGDGTNVATRLKTLENAVSGQTHMHLVDTIADRDKLLGLIAGDKCWVIDATADETVNEGGAEYLYMMDNTWLKVGEAESMDIVCSWDHIQDKPQSKVADIDLAVAKQHIHSNIGTLSHLSEDGAGNLLYKGARIDDGKTWSCLVENLKDLPANLADGALVFVLTKDEGGDDPNGDGGTGPDTGADTGADAGEDNGDNTETGGTDAQGA